MPFQPVDNRRLYEQVADQIAALVRAGEFAPGQRLPAERDLAKSLRVSRPVVREAMIALEIAGLIEVRVGSGAFVRELKARMLIEGETAALAATRATPLDLAAIAARQAEMIAERDAGREWRAADLGFHVAIARASGNAALAALVERLWQEQHAPVFSLLSERVRLRDNWAATVSGHVAVLAAIRGGKRRPARDAMRAHLTQVLSVLTGNAPDAPRPRNGKVASGRRTR